MIRVLQGDCRDAIHTLPERSVHMVCTSPPYFNLRSYLPNDHPDKAKEMGSEKTPAEFVSALVSVFDGVWRALRDDGVCFVNLGDSYASAGGSGIQGKRGQRFDRRHTQEALLDRRQWPDDGIKPKDLIGIPWRFAFAMQASGWYLRSALPWIKRSVMPESTTDRPTSAVEYVFMFTKKPTYFWDAVAVQQSGAIPAGTRAAKGSNVRSDIKDVNGRPPEYWDYTGTRNFRNSDLFFSTLGEPFGLITDAEGAPVALDVNPEPLADHHFAAYPSKLVHPLMLAGTSEYGCCVDCGAPWVRQTEKSTTFTSGSGKSGRKPVGKGAGGRTNRQRHLRYTHGPVVDTKTTGWLPTCACDAPVRPCTVLDPFGGAGTTGLVADRLRRDAILIELNSEYAEMAARRLHKDAGLFAEVAAE